MVITNKRARYAVGATAGFATGAAGSAAVGYAASRALGAAARTSGARAIGSFAVRIAPRAVALVPGVGTAAAVGLSAYSLYQALKPVVAHAQEARKQRQQQKTATTPEEDAASLDRERERLGAKFGGYDKRLDLAIEDARKQAGNKGLSQATRDWWKTRELALTTERQSYKNGGTGSEPKPEQKRTITDDIKDFFKPDPAITARRTQIEKELDTVRKQVDDELKGKNTSGQKGAGKNYDKLVARQKDLEGQLKDASREERDANPLRSGFQTLAPIGASIGGYLAGSKLLSGAGQLKDQAAATASEVGKLGKQAGKLLKSKPNGILAGTPAGDKAKAIVNEAYARGGAKPAFASPGYPASGKTAEQVFSGAGRASKYDYIPPAFNAASAAVAGTVSVFDPNENRRAGERIVAGFEAGMAIGQWRSLAAAPVLRPAASSIASIEALRNRITRETATKSPAGVAVAEAGAKLSQARIAAARGTGIAAINADAATKSAGLRAGGRVAAARISSNQGAVMAGADLGVSKARGAGRVARAEAAANLGPAKSYKDTWEDSRGRIYHRRDMSVRSAKNDNAPRSRSRTN